MLLSLCYDMKDGSGVKDVLKDVFKAYFYMRATLAFDGLQKKRYLPNFERKSF